MTRPQSRLDAEYDAAAAHNLAAEVAEPSGPGRTMHSTTCAYSWVSGESPTLTEARREHDAHRDYELDLGCSRDGVAEAFGVTVSAVASWLNPGAPKKRGARLPSGAVRVMVADWRARDSDRDTILAELESKATTWRGVA